MNSLLSDLGRGPGDRIQGGGFSGVDLGGIAVTAVVEKGGGTFAFTQGHRSPQSVDPIYEGISPAVKELVTRELKSGSATS